MDDKLKRTGTSYCRGDRRRSRGRHLPLCILLSSQFSLELVFTLRFDEKKCESEIFLCYYSNNDIGALGVFIAKSYAKTLKRVVFWLFWTLQSYFHISRKGRNYLIRKYVLSWLRLRGIWYFCIVTFLVYIKNSLKKER